MVRTRTRRWKRTFGIFFPVTRETAAFRRFGQYCARVGSFRTYVRTYVTPYWTREMRNKAGVHTRFYTGTRSI